MQGKAGSLWIDYSKNRITEQTLKYLIEFAKEMKVEEQIQAMFRGDKINITENRSVLHIATRRITDEPVYLNGSDIMPEVRTVRGKMLRKADQIRNGVWKGFGGKPLKNIVNIGIGGSDLGPDMVCEALKHYTANHLSLFFVSNVDGTHISETLKKLNPDETLFLIASKTFTTQETMTNAHTARRWILDHFKETTCVSNHFIALSTNTDAVQKFGIAPQNMFPFWDWVGGRFSLSSSIGMSIAIALGSKGFLQLLKGHQDVDDHLRNTPLEQNMPVILALLGFWYNNFFGSQTHAIIPYDQYLHRLPAHIQQIDMESNGKSVDRNGNPVSWQTGQIIWGEPGTNSQHAFFQLIHQGTKIISSDFIGFVQSLNPTGNHHRILMANFFAQQEALAFGKTKQACIAEGVPETLLPYKTFEGNRPVTCLMAEKLTPQTLGNLIALYEQKTFVQGLLWNVFSFDQWGVELGKVLAKKINKELTDNQIDTLAHDTSTTQQLTRFLEQS
jgi:glucose-6-phosphate isomerase